MVNRTPNKGRRGVIGIQLLTARRLSSLIIYGLIFSCKDYFRCSSTCSIVCSDVNWRFVNSCSILHVVSVPGRLIKDENCNYVVVLATRSYRGKKSLFSSKGLYI